MKAMITHIIMVQVMEAQAVHQVETQVGQGQHRQKMCV